jgi:hypothetical protein
MSADEFDPGKHWPEIQCRFRDKIRADYAQVFELADKVAQFAAGYPEYVSYGDGDNAEAAFKYWNAGFVAAGHRLMRGVMILADHGQAHEAELLVRPMVELVGNQTYMAREPERAVDFLHQLTETKKKLAERTKDYGLTSEEEWPEVIAGLESEAFGLTETVGGPSLEFTNDLRPFGKSAKDRITEAGLTWHYDLLYFTASDITHMGAMSVDWNFKFDDEKSAITKRGVSADGAPGVVTLATEMMLRILYVAESSLEEGVAGQLDALAHEYWLINAKKGLEEQVLISHLRGEATPEDT